MDVSIIFVNYKTRNLTINAINSVMAKTEGISYEIFVVDNASNDGSIEAIENQFPNINIIKSEIIDVFETKKLVEKETKEEKIEKENISLETIDEKIMTIDDFLDDFESSN